MNTRRMAERLARHLSERLGDDAVTAHHGSLSKEKRLDAETRLKTGQLKALVATASLELGIDIGHVDLVCQIGSPHRIATLLQRVGRSGHTIAGTPKGRAVPDVARRPGRMRGAAARGPARRARRIVVARRAARRARAADRRRDGVPRLRARTSCSRWCAAPGRIATLDARATSTRSCAMVADGFATRRGRRGALVHRDEVNRRVRGRRGARLLAITSGGAIPEVADYRVVLDPDDTFIGTLNEDFAIESNAGDIFQLGNASWQILQVGGGDRARRRREGRAADDPVLARRSAGAQRRAVARGQRPARRASIDGSSDADARSRDAIEWLIDETGPRRRTPPSRSSPTSPTAARARRHADAGHARARAVLRRIGRHAARAARAVRQPHQQGVGPGAAQALLPAVQLRAAGGGDRRRAAAVARAAALVPARGRVPLSAPDDGARRARAGVARRAGVQDALALEHDHLAGRAARSAADARCRRSSSGCWPTI